MHGRKARLAAWALAFGLTAFSGCRQGVKPVPADPPSAAPAPAPASAREQAPSRQPEPDLGLPDAQKYALPVKERPTPTPPSTEGRRPQIASSPSKCQHKTKVDRSRPPARALQIKLCQPGTHARTMVHLRDHGIAVAGDIPASTKAGRVFQPFVARIDADGELVPLFGRQGVAHILTGKLATETYAIAEDSQGSIFIGGTQEKNRNDSRSYVAKLRSDGTPDPSFGVGGVAWYEFSQRKEGVHDIFVASDGSLFIAGGSLSSRTAFVAKLDAKGELDESFADRGALEVRSCKHLDEILEVGKGQFFAGGECAVRFDAKGKVRSNEPSGVRMHGHTSRQRVWTSVTEDSKGGFFITGQGGAPTGVKEGRGNGIAVARVRADGSRDPKFGKKGNLIVDVRKYSNGDDGMLTRRTRSGTLEIWTTPNYGRGLERFELPADGTKPADPTKLIPFPHERWDDVYFDDVAVADDDTVFFVGNGRKMIWLVAFGP